jgi:hypothetical protein
MNTAFLFMAQYDGRAVIPLNVVCKDYFPHLKPDQLLRKVAIGEIRLPIMRIEKSQKSAKGVHLQDLAEYIDRQRESARRDLALQLPYLKISESMGNHDSKIVDTASVD